MEKRGIVERGTIVCPEAIDFVKAVLRENRIPFEIAQVTDPFFSESNMAYVKKSVQELRAGKGTAHENILSKKVPSDGKNDKDRLVYHMENGRIYIAHCSGHYGDK